MWHCILCAAAIFCCVRFSPQPGQQAEQNTDYQRWWQQAFSEALSWLQPPNLGTGIRGSDWQCSVCGCDCWDKGHAGAQFHCSQSQRVANLQNYIAQYAAPVYATVCTMHTRMGLLELSDALAAQLDMNSQELLGIKQSVQAEMLRVLQHRLWDVQSNQLVCIISAAQAQMGMLSEWLEMAQTHHDQMTMLSADAKHQRGLDLLHEEENAFDVQLDIRGPKKRYRRFNKSAPKTPSVPNTQDLGRGNQGNRRPRNKRKNQS